MEPDRSPQSADDAPPPLDLLALLDDAFARHGAGEAIVGRFRRLSFAGLDAEADAAAAAMRAAGMRPGDRVAACLPNHPEIVVAFLAAMRIGAVWLGINRALAPAEKLHILRDSGASLLIAEPAAAAELASARGDLPNLRYIAEVDPERGDAWQERVDQHRGAPRLIFAPDPLAPAVLAYTSGTTGRAKAVVHSQHNIALAVAARLTRPWSLTARHGVCTPMTIVNLMIVGPLASLASGGATICVDSTYAPELAEWVERESIRSLSAAAAIFHDLMTRPDIRPEQVRSVQSISMGSAHVPEDFRAVFERRFGDQVSYAYGLTEAPTVVASTTPGEPFAPGSVGRPLPHLRLAILSPEGTPLPPGEDGEIGLAAAVDGPWRGAWRPMLGYWNDPESSAAALAGGWLHTGDLGRLDANGDLFITGRLKDMINRGGSNVYPAEIERVIQEDDEVLYCAVTGKPDARLGETVAAFIQPVDRDVDRVKLADQLRNRCGAALARYKVPTDWLFVDEMPRNDMKKIVKAQLKASYFTTVPDTGAYAPRRA
ncbi:MAG: acyl--CoA ligase [Sphingomonadaceae bacterium]|nr:acyl--CoA ligase [Sphingomonadaceae bacterium]